MVAYQVENNESQMMGIRKREYLRVLSNIVKESQQAQVIVWGWGARDCPVVPLWAFTRAVDSPRAHAWRKNPPRMNPRHSLQCVC